MAITDYGTLKTAVSEWLARADGELAGRVPDFIRFGELRIQRELRLRATEKALSAVMSSGEITVPSDYVDLKFAYIDGSPTQILERKSPEWIYRNYAIRTSTHKPIYIARDNTKFIFGPFPDSDYTVLGTYYYALDALSDLNTTNWFTANAPDLLLYSALLESAPYLGADNRTNLWETLYQRAKSEVMRQEDVERFSGSVLSIATA